LLRPGKQNGTALEGDFPPQFLGSMVSFQGVYMVLGKLWPQKKPVGQPNGSGSAAPPK